MFQNLLLNEYVWSGVITFIAAFGATALPFAMNVPVDQAALWAALAVCVRAGTSAVINLLATKGTTISSKPLN